jgi:hypothetical protein
MVLATSQDKVLPVTPSGTAGADSPTIASYETPSISPVPDSHVFGQRLEEKLPSSPGVVYTNSDERGVVEDDDEVEHSGEPEM